jgi:hypothetical protein
MISAMPIAIQSCFNRVEPGSFASAAATAAPAVPLPGKARLFRAFASFADGGFSEDDHEERHDADTPAGEHQVCLDDQKRG